MEVTREEILFERVLAREDRPADWTELDLLASRDTELWSRLPQALRADACLRAAVAPLLAVAESVDLPRSQQQPARQWFAAAGWLLASLLAVGWLGDRKATVATPDLQQRLSTQSSADLSSTAGELAPVVLEASPVSSGGYDVLLMRRSLQRVSVPMLYGVSFDEHGVASRVPASVPLSKNY